MKKILSVMLLATVLIFVEGSQAELAKFMSDITATVLQFTF